ncbi:aspartate kinase [Pleomorphovibrio marinus]|uniref:aspartate kinase n=1 Tax=Pleomorphovibrio marinus TaxID=2164132 RepID=UPI000E0C66DC|nr:aspartate kinase [Pleomorphovibrio marinus]
MIQPLVYKFGGASVKDADSIENVAKVLNTNWKQGLIVVVSAMGDTTDLLEEIINKAFVREPFSTELEKVESLHQEACQQLFPGNHSIFNRLKNDFSKLKRTLENQKFIEEGEAFFYDQIIGFGELISTRILQEYLCLQGNYCLWQDARELIATDSNHKIGRVDWVLTMQQCRKLLVSQLERYPVITQGFMGSDWLNHTVTLGREGSDFTAAILAVSLGAKSVTIWKDVSGILNGDPDLFPDAVKFEYLDFEEAAEMTYFGAKVIHPKTVKPLAKHKIPLYVKSFVEPSSTGTVIGSFQDDPRIPITVIKKNQVLLTFRIRDLSRIGGFHFEEIFKAAKQQNWTINLIQASAVTLRAVLDVMDKPRLVLPKSLQEVFVVEQQANLSLVTVKNYTQDQESKYGAKENGIRLSQKSPTTLQYLMEKIPL